MLGASWPFLLLLFAIFILNEALHKYHDRLVFTSILFFFALYSCAIFELPIYTHTVGTQTFLESGAITVAVFAAFLTQLRVSGRQRFLKDAWRIRAGALLVLTVLNVFYFANILPPLPISLVAGGIYHGVARQGNVYVAEAEEQDWKVDFGAPAVLHVVPDESLYAYSAVFAPTALSTTIVHVWQWYDPVAKTWVTKSSLAFPINGGRDGGYRGYSAKTNPDAGMWRVDVETGDGHLIGRLRFTVVPVSLPPAETTETLN